MSNLKYKRVEKNLIIWINTYNSNNTNNIYILYKTADVFK